MSDDDDIDYTPPPPKVVKKFVLHTPKDGICFYCNEETNSLAGNPSKWALRLPVDPKEPGRPKTVCTGCVLERLRIAESLKEARRKALAVVRRAEEERIDELEADYQVNGIIPLARELGVDAVELAQRIAKEAHE